MLAIFAEYSALDILRSLQEMILFLNKRGSYMHDRIDRRGGPGPSPKLLELAAEIATNIERTPHVFRSRRRSSTSEVVSSGWIERLHNYVWESRKPGETPERLSGDFENLSRKIDAVLPLSDEDAISLKQLALRTFEWGGVTRGRSKANPSIEDIVTVIRCALRGEPGPKHLMDSGWTKVTAFSTAWLEGTHRNPQAIYDSRVAAGLMRTIERVMPRSDPRWMSDLGRMLLNTLSKVPSRSDKRFAGLDQKWQTRNAKWTAQFFASDLLGLVRDELNRGNWRRELGRDWTVRDVEKVFFMEGY